MKIKCSKCGKMMNVSSLNEAWSKGWDTTHGAITTKHLCKNCSSKKAMINEQTKK